MPKKTKADFLAAARALPRAPDIDVVIKLFSEAVGEPQAFIEQLVEEAAQATDLSIGQIRKAAEDGKRYHAEQGRYLGSHAAAAEAAIAAIEGEAGILKYADGDFYLYPTNPTLSEFGTWNRIPRSEMEEGLQNALPAATVATKSDRSEVMGHMASRCRDDALFGAEAPAGVAVRNGFVVLDDASGEVSLRPHAAENMARFKLDVDYAPASRAPQFNSKLHRALGSQRRVEALLQFVACALFHHRPRYDRMRTCALLVGPPRSGKSANLQWIRGLFEPRVLGSVPPQYWTRPEHVVALAGVMLNTVTEIDSDAALRGDVLKKVLSWEPVLGRWMRKNPFAFTPEAFHIFLGNRVPRIGEKDRSLLRRFLVIRLPSSLTDDEAREDFAAVVEEEKAGILNLLIEHVVQVQRRGVFTLPEDNDELVLRMQFGDDLVALFARTRLQAAPGARATTAELMGALRDLAAELGMDPEESVHAGTMRRLAREMAVLYGAERGKSNGAPYYTGVRLREPGSAGQGEGVAEVGSVGDGGVADAEGAAEPPEDARHDDVAGL